MRFLQKRLVKTSDFTSRRGYQVGGVFFMNVIEVKDGCPIKGEIEQMTDEQLQNEYNFYIAESIVAMLHREGKITDDELHKISALNRQKFSPKLAEIMS